MPRPIYLVALALWLNVSLAAGSSWAQDSKLAEPPERDVGKVEMTDLDVVLTNADGDPVVGAAVMPYAMRMIETQGHGFWSDDLLGPPREYFSDEQGIATIRYPKWMRYLERQMTTKLITFQVRHSDYVQHVEHFELGEEPDAIPDRAELTLDKGCELELAAKDENGTGIEQFGIVMAGPYAPEFWASTEGGGKRTSSVKDGTWQTMLVAPQENGPTLFSGLLPLKLKSGQSVRMRNVMLSPGVVLRGKLSDNVPRPIINGRVSAVAAPKPAGDSYGEVEPSLIWHSDAEVDQDGSFVFPSLPRSGQVQLIAVCDGFVAKTTIPEAGPFVMGQLFDIVEPQTHVEIEMEQTGAVEITFRKPDGSLLESGAAGSSPNQRWYKSGSTLVGESYDSLDSIKRQLLPAEERALHPSWRSRKTTQRFVDQPVVDGRVTLHDIPVGAIGGNSAILVHEEYEVPMLGGQQMGKLSFELRPGEVTKVSVTVSSRSQPMVERALQKAAQAVGGLLQKTLPKNK